MAKEELKIGEISKPRYEFRTFGQHFEESTKRMARFSVPVPEKVVSASLNDTTVKHVVAGPDDKYELLCLLYCRLTREACMGEVGFPDALWYTNSFEYADHRGAVQIC